MHGHYLYPGCLKNILAKIRLKSRFSLDIESSSSDLASAMAPPWVVWHKIGVPGFVLVKNLLTVCLAFIKKILEKQQGGDFKKKNWWLKAKLINMRIIPQRLMWNKQISLDFNVSDCGFSCGWTPQATTG